MHHQVQGMITMKKLPQKKVILKSINTDIDLSEKHYEPLSIWVVPIPQNLVSGPLTT